MKKYRNSVLFLGVLFIIILGGLFPVIVAKVEDHLVDDKVHYEEMKTLNMFQQLNDTQKAYLLAHGVKTEISRQRASLKQEEMQEILTEALASYYGIGLIKSDVTEFSFQCTPFLYYNSTESNFSAVFWQVQMETVTEYGQHLLLYLDDETGRIMTISYECTEPVYETGKFDYYIKKMSSLYRSCMDFESVEDVVPAEINGTNSEYGYENQKKTYKRELHWSVIDDVYGELDIGFILTNRGFKIGIDN
ncbi:MAG: hypothetical protein E7253_07445 [Lachnospiraceae bacterium]|nr:hypothetical protein [Lachnospiraceae bacterium]